MPTRRTTLLLPLIGLAGCGFHPLYAPIDKAGDTVGSADLAAINVQLIPDREGQLLRQALQQRFEGTGTDIKKRYDLAATISVGQEGIAILPDSTASRIRFTGSATFILRAQDAAQTVITQGTVRSTDDANVFDNQYFGLDQEADTINRRMAETLADQIALTLAAYFRAHPAPG